jgi:type I restriction enzyme M protein
MPKPTPQQPATAQSLGAQLKSARDIMRKDKGLNGDLDQLPDVLKVRPISDHDNVNEIIGKFGGADQLRNAVNQLQSLLYAT